MSRKVASMLLGLLSSLAIAAPAAAQGAGEVSQWNFDVFLNDKKVGKHSFTVSEADGQKQVQSEASFKYTIPTR